MWVRLAVKGHSGPAMCNDLDVRSMNVGIALNEVGSEDGAEEFRGVHRVELCLDYSRKISQLIQRWDIGIMRRTVDGVLDGVSRNDNAVVGLGVRGLDITLEECADGHFSDGLSLGRLIAINLQDADIVLLRSCQYR